MAIQDAGHRVRVGAAKAIQWDQRQRGDPDNVASRGGYRMKFYAPEAFDGFLTAEFAIV